MKVILKNILILSALVIAGAGNLHAREGEHASPSEANLRVPLDIPLFLSGNFGELRPNHFHSGIDFKTQQKTGFAVHCAADGYVSRIVVSPWGFGRAVYVTHPDLGLVTVYGHLESFASKIDRPVRDRQYEAENFTIDTQFEPGEITLSRGEILGHSGNAGSSGGPHLHMDVRDAITEYALDPLAYYHCYLKDDVRPEVRAIALYPREGLVDGASRPVYHSGANISAPFTAWGRVVPAIKAYDKMTGTTNIYGIKYMTLLCDGDTLYHRVIDHVDFDRTRAVNTLAEYADVVDAKSWNMITEIPDANPLPDMVSASGDGSLYIDSEREYKLQFILRDEHGNTTRVPFSIMGSRADIPIPAGNDELTLHDRDNTIVADDGTTAFIPAGTLYGDKFINIVTGGIPSDEYLSRQYSIGDPHIPLAGNITITLPLTASRGNIEPARYTMVRLEAGKKPAAVTATYLPGGLMQARVNRFGTYAVTIDTVAPKITPVTPEKWKLNGRIVYKIKDELSGIDNYRGEINGKWAMFEYDGKTGTLSYKIDPARAGKGPYTIKLTVTDAAGNTTTHSKRL